MNWSAVLLGLLRVRQWYKNVLVFAPLVFADLLTYPQMVERSALAFGVFCALSSAVYVMNDVVDAQRDALHPRKRRRPIPSGRVSKGQAIGVMVVLLLTAVALSLPMPPTFWMVALGYVALSTAYTVYLKRVFLVDVLAIGFGFVLRVLAGCAVLGVIISPWLFTATFLLAMLLAFSKRKSELASMDDAPSHRSVLLKYDGTMLDAFVLLSAISVLIVYLIYSIMVAESEYFVLTSPFVLYGVLRFLSMHMQAGYDPDDMLRERAFVMNLLAWVILVVVLLYVL